MRSLFLKIFLWFWLAIILVNVVTFVSFFITHDERRMRLPRETFAPAIAAYAETASEIYERKGSLALKEYLERAESASHLRAFLFDANGHELSERGAPPEAREAAENFARRVPMPSENTRPLTDDARPPRFAERSFTSPQGVSYVLVVELPKPPPPPRFRDELHHHLIQMLVILFVGGAFCYWLARHLTSPIISLRVTTRALAEGDLKARVGESLTRRHDELALLGRDFNLMAERIESLLTAQGRLLGDISHELRSPLARLGIALGLARQRAADEAAGALDRIERESETLNEMIGRLLTLTRLESGANGVERAPLHLTSLVRRIVADADFEASDHNRAVKLIVADSCVVSGAAELLKSAIENVVRNAVRHTAEKTTVEVSIESRDAGAQRRAVITVRDHGAGAPEESLGKIFQPFYRVESARDRQSGGTGLGLAIAARAVQLHGGDIAARNAPATEGGGLIVEISLPLFADYADERAAGDGEFR